MAEIKKPGQSNIPLPEDARAPQGGSAIQAGFADVQQGLGNQVGELLEAKKRIDRVDNNTWLINLNNEYQRESREFNTQALSRKGRDAQQNMEESTKLFKRWEGRINKEAPNPEYKNMALEHISNLQNKADDTLIVHATKELETSAATAIGETIDEAAESVSLNGGTVEAIDAGLEGLEPFFSLHASEFGGEKADAMRTEASQHVANNAINKRMRLDPVQTLADLEAGKYNKYITSEENEAHIKNARAEAKWQKNQAEEAIADAQSEVVSEIVKTPTLVEIDKALESPIFEGDARATKTLVNIKNVLVNGQKETERNARYAKALNDPNLVNKTDMEIRQEVPDIGDANGVLRYRDSVLKNPSVAGQSYNEVVKSFKSDHTDKDGSKFKTDDDPTGDIEYIRQLRSFQEWAIANPEKDPVEYYEQIMAPVNADFFDRVFNLGPSEADPIASRQREAWIVRAKESNPDYTDEELREHYDTNIRGTQ